VDPREERLAVLMGGQLDHDQSDSRHHVDHIFLIEKGSMKKIRINLSLPFQPLKEVTEKRSLLTLKDNLCIGPGVIIDLEEEQKSLIVKLDHPCFEHCSTIDSGGFRLWRLYQNKISLVRITWIV